jgi:MOSC domain-containing protein YiiM
MAAMNPPRVLSRVLSVNVGQPAAYPGVETPDQIGNRTAIGKRPVAGAVGVHPLGLEGDGVGSPHLHGGYDQAVYAFAREDLDRWAAELARTVPDGQFGENLTTAGIDVNEALVGERWRVGTALLEVSAPRIPCNTFKTWMGAGGFDAAGWVKRFTADGRSGAYLRVIEQGRLEAGDPIVVDSRPDHEVTIAFMFRALTTERSWLPRLLAADAIPARLRAKLEAAPST